MKRFITFILVILTLCYFSITCSAAEYKENVDVNVYAKYHYYSNSDIETACVENGKGIIENEDNTFIVVDFASSDYDGYVLVVHRISEGNKDAFEWFKSCVPNTVKSFEPYDIYLMNPEKKRMELPEEALIQIATTSFNNYAIGLSCDGEIEEINFTNKNGVILLKSSLRCSYYLLCEKILEIESPQTGEPSNICLWTVFFISSSCAFIVTRKKRQIRISK